MYELNKFAIMPQFVSSFYDTDIEELLSNISLAYDNSKLKLSTKSLTAAVLAISSAHPPAHDNKLKFAHMGGNNPFTIVVHCKKPLLDNYKQFLIKRLQKIFCLKHVPINLILKTK